MTPKELLDCLNYRSLNYPVIWTGVSLTSPTALLGCLNRHPAMLNFFNYLVTQTGVSLTSLIALLGCLNRYPAILNFFNFLMIQTGVSSTSLIVLLGCLNRYLVMLNSFNYLVIQTRLTWFDNYLSCKVYQQVLIKGLIVCPYPLLRFPARFSNQNNLGIN